MKRIFCLLLAVLMVLSMAACGKDEQNENGGGSDNGTVNSGDQGSDSTGGNEENGGETKPSEPALNDYGPWVLVQEYDNGSSRNNKKYHYDEMGRLVSYELYNSLELLRNYMVSYTDTADGGTLAEVQSKHIQDSEFEKSLEKEYDDEGKLIKHVQYALGKANGTVYTFAYNEDGKVVEHRRTYEGEWKESLTFTYEGDRLTESHYTSSSGSYANYIYTYNADGLPETLKVESDYLDSYSKYTLTFEIKETEDDELYQLKLKVAEDCEPPVAGRTVFIYEEHYDEDGKPYKIVVESKPWGIFNTGWMPTGELGCMTSSNWFSGTVKLTYEPLSVHLAEQGQ